MSRSVSIIGGTGPLGMGLALRWAAAEMQILIGSRDADRAAQAAEKIRERVPGANVRGDANVEVAGSSEIVVLTLPLGAQVATAVSIRDRLQPGAILVDTTVPLDKAVGGRLSQLLPLWDGSAAERVARRLGDRVRVVSAFHALSASALAALDTPLHSDTLICGDDSQARRVVAELAARIPGVRAIDNGALENSRYAEAVAALLISLNLRHKIKDSGVRFQGLPVVAGGE